MDHLDESIDFINRSSNDKTKRNILCNILTEDMIKLDMMDRSDQRKNMIIAIQNVLHQLDNMFRDDKTSIQLQLNTGGRQSYLPQNKNSHAALNTTYSTNLTSNSK